MPSSLVPFRDLRLTVLTCVVLATPARAGTWGGITSGARLLIEDLAYMVSSPVRLDRTGWLQTAGVLGAGAVIYAYDQEIFDAFQEAKGNKAYEALLYLGHQWEPIGNMGNTNAYYVGAATVGWLAVGPIPAAEPLAVIPTQILESHITTGGIRNVAEVAIGRLRPFESQGPYAFDPGEGTSFPSGHASVVFELAGILSHHGFRTPFGRPIWGFTHFAATSLALERIDSETHWPSDVYIASVLGAITSRTIVRRWEERATRNNQAPTSARFTVSPSFARGGGGLQIDVRF
jgi:membrane-associated phospholipid phosphatase